jgi:hypothetical protein
MKATKGKANPGMLDQLLKQLIDEGWAILSPEHTDWLMCWEN